MDIIRRQYYRFLVFFMLILCALCICLSYVTIKGAENVHAKQTYDQIFLIKKTFLKDTVQNMIRDIDMIRDLKRENARMALKVIEYDLTQCYSKTPDAFLVTCRTVFERQAYRDKVDSILDNVETGAIILESGRPGVFSIDTPMDTTIRFGKFRVRLRINEDAINKETKASVAAIIYSQTFADDGYLWVNEITNWEGGDGYAIRRIHPNLKNTEGSLLSTNTKDIKGNLPYLTELEGVKKDGEVFSTYFFKRKNNDQIAEKLTYATLYKDFDWIVAMGVYLEDVQVYIDDAQKPNQTLTARLLSGAAVLLVFLFLGGLFVLTRMEKWYLQRSRHVIREESNVDPLTGALNRRIGDIYLIEGLKRFHRGLDNPVLLFIDIDNFKKINDTYGHDAGDVVLKSVVDQIYQNLRSTDRLLRWGGEEFLLLCYGVERDSALSLALKLNRTISMAPIVIGKTDAAPTCNFDLEACAFMACETVDRLNSLCITRDGEKVLFVSVSIGVTWFDKADINPDSALKRVDEALYKAKSEGKNCVRLL